MPSTVLGGGNKVVHRIHMVLAPKELTFCGIAGGEKKNKHLWGCWDWPAQRRTFGRETHSGGWREEQHTAVWPQEVHMFLSLHP